MPAPVPRVTFALDDCLTSSTPVESWTVAASATPPTATTPSPARSPINGRVRLDLSDIACLLKLSVERGRARRCSELVVVCR